MMRTLTPAKATFVWEWPETWPRLWGVLDSVTTQPVRTLTPPASRTLSAPTPATLEPADG